MKKSILVLMFAVIALTSSVQCFNAFEYPYPNYSQKHGIGRDKVVKINDGLYTMVI